MKHTITITISAFVIYATMIFTVLFDPSELALGAQFITLPAFLSVMAEGLGNITWLVGILYLFITIIAVVLLSADEAFDNMIAKCKADESFKNYKMKWRTIPMIIIGLIVSLVALGSGFWFTGFFWFVGIISWNSLSAKVRKTEEYKFFR